ncbi:hypothetical protein NWI01_21900 [Nitrobacter winogradskyi]|uniref:Uncharacterized protein n=2 Tax=Nitrobacter winogradskyi TaxID=913 RepID=A0A4Y3WCR1_NITWI|nr:hypothetical protein NWI01_21900 [Nitrobacter winogradskyi]
MQARMNKRALFILAAISVAAADVHAAPDLIDDAAGSQACFTRNYDAAHLAKKPNQKTTSMRFALRRETYPDSVDTPLLTFARLEIMRRNDTRPWRAIGQCAFDQQANRADGRAIVSNYARADGIACHMTGENLDAEGGIFMIESVDNKLKIYIDDDITMRTEARVTEGPGEYVAFGPADSTFILDRAADDACADLHKSIAAE